MHDDTAVSMAEERADTEDMRTYVSELSLTSPGTKAAARCSEEERKTMVMIAPRRIWKAMRV